MKTSSTIVSVLGATLVVTLQAQQSPLWTAAQQGNLDQVRSLLGSGVDLNARDPNGATALYLAAEAGHPPVVEYLLDHGADPTILADTTVDGRQYRLSALGAAALGWHEDVARTLLERLPTPPEYVVSHHELIPFSPGELESLRDWEIINTVLRMPDVAPVTRAIVERDVVGTYRAHDGRAFRARLDGSHLELTEAGGSVRRFGAVGGKAFMERVPPGSPREAAAQARPRSERDLTMLRRFLQPLPPDQRDDFVTQFIDRGGTWLDFTIGEGRVLGFEIREGGPARMGGVPTIFLKTGVRPPSSALLEREIAGSRIPGSAMNWPSFRGPDAAGVADGQAPPIQWDAASGHNIRWQTPIPGFGNSSPIIWGDKIFITTAVSSDPNAEFQPGGLRGDNVSNDRSEHAFQVICLDRTTGRILWERTAHVGVPRAGRHLKSTYASATPATDGRYLVVSFGAEGLFCYDLDGNLVWKKDLGLVGHERWGFASSPVIFDDMVILQSDTNVERREAPPRSFIAAFALADGAERWRALRDEDNRSSFGSPTVYRGAAGAQIVTNGGNSARAYDPKTGKELWGLRAPSDIVTPSPVVGNELIYIMSGNTGYQPIFAVRPNAVGDITLPPGQDTNDFVAWSSIRGGSFTPTPIVYGDLFYSINVSGIVGCYDAATGERRYLSRLHHLGAGFSSSPVAADGYLFFASEDGDVFVVKAGPEFELVSSNAMGEVIMATPAISGGMIFVRTLHHVFGIGARF